MVIKPVTDKKCGLLLLYIKKLNDKNFYKFNGAMNRFLTNQGPRNISAFYEASLCYTFRGVLEFTAEKIILWEGNGQS